MTRVALAMIVRDAGHTLRACLESIKPHVDHITIVDTGSTDDTPAIAQEFADKYERYDGCNVNPYTGQVDDKIWDFSDARNRSFALVPDDIDAVFWADADDIVTGAENLRSMAAAMPDGHSAYLMPYEYSYADAACTMPTCIHWRERLIKGWRDFHWLTPCHEVCLPRIPVPLQTLPGGEVVRILHRAQAAASLPNAKPREIGRNLRILTAYLQRSGEGDVRAMYYCGVEHARHGQFGHARKVLKRYVELAKWSDEKCLAELELARIYLGEGECDEALRWADAALNTKSWPDPYWLKCKTFYRMAAEGTAADQEYHLRRAHAWAERGQPLEDAQTVLFYNPTERFETERIVNRIKAHFGDIDGAAESCRRGLKGMPGDPELMEYLKQYEAVRIGRELDTQLARLVALGKISEQVKHAVESLVSGTIQLPTPAEVAAQQNPFARVGSGERIDEATLDPVPADRMDIVIFTGPAMEPWNPATIETTGMGGSETMAWEMARGLARLGHRVRHYGMCTPEQEGRFDGVYWLDASKYRDVTTDVLVVSRYAAAADVPVRARATCLWLHDVHAGPALDPIRAGRFDRVLCLSEWHKSFVCEVYPFLDPGRVVVTRNGIDLGMFDPERPYCEDCGGFKGALHGKGSGELDATCASSFDGALVRSPDDHQWVQQVPLKREPHRAVYSSSPDRGLQTALELWPLVRAEVPDAELHVYYGFDNLRRGRPADVALAGKLEATAKATAGVVLHGRIPPRELAREFMRSGVWFYPTWFSETSCITAMQAQAAGLVCLTSPIAALNETVPQGVYQDQPAAPAPLDINQSFECGPCSDEYKKWAVHHLAAAFVVAEGMGSPGNIEQAQRFSLPALCSDWSEMLTTLVASLQENPVPAFYVAPVFAKAAREVDESEAA